MRYKILCVGYPASIIFFMLADLLNDFWNPFASLSCLLPTVEAQQRECKISPTNVLIQRMSISKKLLGRGITTVHTPTEIGTK